MADSATVHVITRERGGQLARLSLMFLGLLLCSCMVPPGAESGDIPRATVTDRLRSYFPHAAFDGRCSYSRAMDQNESVARYLAVIDQQAGRITDLDCFLPGRAERPPQAGMTARYYYANGFLQLREDGTGRLADPSGFIRASGLDRAPPTGEIYYLLALSVGESGFVDCSQRLATAAAQAGVLEAAEYWRALEAARPLTEQACTDQTYLSLLPAGLR